MTIGSATATPHMPPHHDAHGAHRPAQAAAAPPPPPPAPAATDSDGDHDGTGGKKLNKSA